MTEQEWLECTCPEKMMKFLRVKRKLRLYAVACCRRLFPLFSESLTCRVVEAAERFADGQIGRRRLRAIWNEFFHQGVRYSYFSPDWFARGAVDELILHYCLKHRPRPMWSDTAISAVVAANCRWWSLWGRRNIRTAERTAQCHILRDIVGNPFRSVSVAPSSLCWNDGMIPKIAQTICEERRHEDMPILADALEEAGCTNTDILNHCRSEGQHVRGCWVVDLILGKQ